MCNMEKQVDNMEKTDIFAHLHPIFCIFTKKNTTFVKEIKNEKFFFYQQNKTCKWKY